MAEVKIIISSSYFMVFILIVNSQDAVFVAERASLEAAVKSYVLCEAVGYVPGKCSRESIEQYSYPLLNIVFYFSAFLVPVVELLFVINFTNLKKKVGWLKANSLKWLSLRGSD